jgi:hypothetical protein
MKRILLLISIFFLAKIGYSQNDFRNAYIITHAGDTIVGLIDYREGGKAHKVCDFKKSKDEPVVSYEPTSIRGYGFENDKIFQSREILINHALYQVPEVVFLEVLVRGIVSLYRLDKKFFIEKNDGELQQLLNQHKEVVVNGVKHIKETNEFVGTLTIALFDCPELRAKIQKTKLAEKGLTKLIDDYNRCTGSPGIAFKAKKPWTKGMIGVTGGFNSSRLLFTSNGVTGYEHLNDDFEVSNAPLIGVSFDILSPRLSERFSFHGDIFYVKSTYYGYNLIENLSSTQRNYVTIDLQQLNVPLGFRYTFPEKKVTPYLNAGITGILHLSSGSTWVQELETNNVVLTYRDEALPMKNYQLGLWGGIGVLKSINRKLNGFIEFRYERTNGISQQPIDPDGGGHSNVINLQVLIGIRTK